MYDIYTIEEGDTLTKIANKSGTTEDILKQLNGSMINIMPGNTIVIPKRRNDYFDYYMVEKGDTLYKIASERGIDVSLLAQLNGINESDYIYPNQTLLIPKAGSILYITGVGDTLQEIVKGMNVPMDKFINQNDNIYLQPEQLLIYRNK